MGEHGGLGSGRDFVRAHPRRTGPLRALRAHDPALPEGRHAGREGALQGWAYIVDKQGLGQALF